MSHGSPSPISCPDQVNAGPKPEERSEGDLTPKASSPPGSLDQVGRGSKRQEWPEEDLTTTANEGGGFYSLRLGESFEGGRFVITGKLGWGGLSSVWLAQDCKEDRHVAIKVLSSHASKENKAGRLRERDVLRKIANAAPLHPGSQHVVHLLHEFTFESYVGQHICFVTNVLCYNVPRLQKEPNVLRFPLKFVLRLAKHVLKGLEYLHDECDVVHSALEPTSILLMTPDLDEVIMRESAERGAELDVFPKNTRSVHITPVVSAPLPHAAHGDEPPPFHWVIAGFGHSHLQGEHLSDVVQPHALSAPEVVLGLGLGPAIDIWSLGCMMYEFATGNRLFRPKTKGDIPRDIDHLAQMTRRTGQDHSDVTLEKYGIREKQNDIKGLLTRATAEGDKLESIESDLNELTTDDDGPEEVAAFVRIVLLFLALDPVQRPRAVEALLDPAFDHV